MFNFDDLFGESGMSGGSGHDDCPVLPMILSTIMLPKPFGMMWDDEIITEFLKARGYKILSIKEDGDEFDVAVKSDDPVIPEEPNIVTTFEKELQRSIINILLKNG